MGGCMWHSLPVFWLWVKFQGCVYYLVKRERESKVKRSLEAKRKEKKRGKRGKVRRCKGAEVSHGSSGGWGVWIGWLSVGG